ncbi:MAG: hypothetical protein QOG44_2251 [Acidimicrobiaceae bacterium]|nr:hypothetical protein [Acidimicrobiaceae bacterium]MDQ1366361.1 hypothetical protein [Acidimicrobiaceae bacterium]MDQ1398177.1 hypothetical protein [Acidimicrobiaceae bacterium]MDQ1440479.1 hypothetical protein [Acidimicrobiaceae bacterium]
MTLWTVGHGKRAAEELLEIIGAEAIGLLVDVRRFPASRRNPQFGRAPLEAALAIGGVRYEWWGETLGGRRRPLPSGSRHPAWHDAAFRGYADHLDRPEVREAFSQLLSVSDEIRTAVMCSETVWWRCHRRLLSDAAELAGTPVVHLLAPGRTQPHVLHPGVRADEDGWPVYDVGAQPHLL